MERYVIVNNKRLVVFVALIVSMLSGCFSVRVSDTTYPERKSPLREGPGGAEGELYDFVRSESERYTGEVVSIGLFPGYPCLAEKMDSYVSSGIFLPFGLVLGNCWFAVPTICSLFVEPFTMSSERECGKADIYSSGLLGVFRWREKSHTETEVVYREDVLIDSGWQTKDKVPMTQTADGINVYFVYPGFQSLMRDVEKSDKVDVVFDDGSKIRRFFKSDKNELHLAFKDRNLSDEHVVQELHSKYSKWKVVRENADSLDKEPGYMVAGETLRNEIIEFKRDIADVIADVHGYSRHNVSDSAAKERGFRSELRKLESNRVGELKKKVSKLFAQGELDSAREICVEEGENLSEWLSKIDAAIAERKRKAAEEAERIRVQAKLKEVEELLAKEMFAKARQKCEIGPAFDDIRNRIDKAEQRAKTEAEEKRVLEKIKYAQVLRDRGELRQAAFLCESEKDNRLSSLGRSCMGAHVRKVLPVVLDLFDKGDFEEVMNLTKFETEKQILVIREKSALKLKSMRIFNGVEFGAPVRNYGIPIKEDRSSTKEFLLSPDEKRLSYQRADYTPSKVFRGFAVGEVHGTWKGGRTFRVVYKCAFDRDQQVTTDRAEYSQTLEALTRKYGAPRTEKGFGGDMTHTFQTGELFVCLKYVSEGLIDRGNMTLVAWSPKLLELAEKESDEFVGGLRDFESRKIKAGGEDAL